MGPNLKIHFSLKKKNCKVFGIWMAQFLLSEYNELRKEKLQLDHWGFDLPSEKAKEVCALQAENQKSVHLMQSPFCVPGNRHCIRWLLLK